MARKPVNLGPHRKAPEERKELSLVVRLTEKQKALMAVAAERAGLSLSTWLRNLGMKETSRLGL